MGNLLGRPGGFGITYLCWDVNLKIRVAIKEYLPRDLASRHTDGNTVVPYGNEDANLLSYGLERFKKEALLLATFNHPNIVKVRDYFEENNTGYLVMDYYEGMTLSSYVEAYNGRLPENIANNIMLHVLDGLKEAHSRDILHRDVDPSNIYITKGGQVILLDFGAARVAVGERSRTLEAVLKPGYAPFEQYNTDGDQGPWTDIYACGATLYFLRYRKGAGFIYRSACRR